MKKYNVSMIVCFIAFIIVILLLVLLLSILPKKEKFDDIPDETIFTTLPTETTTSATTKTSITSTKSTISQTTSTTTKYEAPSIKNVTMSIDKFDRKSITIIIKDLNKNPYSYGTKFSVYENINGEWIKLDYKDANPRWNAIAYRPNENNELMLVLDVEKYYGELNAGTYRVEKCLDKDSIFIYSNVFEINELN